MALPSPEHKPARSRAHHPTRGLPSGLFPAQTGKTDRGKSPSARRRGSGDPLPPPSPPASCARLRRAPGELLPGQSQVRRSGARAGSAEGSRSSQPARNPAQNQLFSSRGAPCAPPCEGTRPPAAKTCGPERRQPEPSPTAALPRSGGAARGPACRSRPRTRKLPGGRVQKAAASPALWAAAAPAKGTGRGTRCEALVPRVAKWTEARGVLSRAPAARAQALPAGRGLGPRPPRGARSAPAGRARARQEDGAESAGRLRGGTLHFNSP